MTRKVNFTKTALQGLVPNGRIQYVHDEKTPGLMVLVSPAGARTFYVQRRIQGERERIKLGSFPSMTAENARRKAAELNGSIAIGANPAEAKRSIRAEPRLDDVIERFLSERRNRRGKPLASKTVSEYRRIANAYLKPLLRRRLSEVTPEAVRQVHRKIESDATANQARALLSAVFAFARDSSLTDLSSPTSKVKLRAMDARERFLQPDELPRFFDAVNESPLKDFFLLALLSGARRSNLQAMRWDAVNLEEGTWFLPTTKNGHSQHVVLPPAAVEILRARYATRTYGDVFVFPGSGASGHLTEPKSAWAGVLKRAGIANLRIHDLRRTMGSWQARQGTSLAIIGKSLNHKTQQATAIYARLDLDPVRQSVNNAAAAMLEAAGVKATAEVLPFKRQRG